ncbi:hypothetical protein BN14_09137 [Rhizoctonia solani AG-1 IB]|uniref:Uncharacterized protein n=1 Tax=Thanatephorus cucumeris (strain AG1-IB / isolate 7/3/14) TaxID=1108050 RepID=M5C6S5_THACB|nr:hypothetical protein BN14_09137 [Rhizoctonia solani AG-1 IB]
MRANIKHGAEHREGNIVSHYKEVLRFESTVRHAILGLPTALSFVKSMVDSAAIELASKQKVTDEISVFGSLKLALKDAYSDAWLVGGKSLIQAAKLLDDNIKKLTRGSEESTLEFLRPCLLNALGALTNLAVMMPVVEDQTGTWAFILWQQFSEIMTDEIFNDFDGLITQAARDKVFRYKAFSMVENSSTVHQHGLASLVKCRSFITIRA